MKTHLAEVAREDARTNYHGNTSAAISNLQPLADLFEMVDEVSLDSLNEDWSGAFAFWCTHVAEIGLPIRYPDSRVHASFASVDAWEEYARLPKISAWHWSDEEPVVGDLVIFEQKPGKPPKMGIVLSVADDTIDVAAGNHHNHSAIIEHAKHEGIRGYVRLKSG